MYLRFPFRLVAFGRAGFSNELVHDPRGRVKPPLFFDFYFFWYYWPGFSVSPRPVLTSD